jgi:hypothetical protein
LNKVLIKEENFEPKIIIIFSDPTPPDYLRYMKSKVLPDDPNINFGKAIIEVAVYIDESMFKHKFGEDMTLISRYVTIMLAYLQKQLLQRNIEKHIKIKLIVKYFGVAPFDVVHNMTTGQYLLHFCQWKQSQAKADVSILFTKYYIFCKTFKSFKNF